MYPACSGVFSRAVSGRPQGGVVVLLEGPVPEVKTASPTYSEAEAG